MQPIRRSFGRTIRSRKQVGVTRGGLSQTWPTMDFIGQVKTAMNENPAAWATPRLTLSVWLRPRAAEATRSTSTLREQAPLENHLLTSLEQGLNKTARGCRVAATPGERSWQRGLAPFVAERPEGCFAQTVPVPFTARNPSPKPRWGIPVSSLLLPRVAAARQPWSVLLQALRAILAVVTSSTAIRERRTDSKSGSALQQSNARPTRFHKARYANYYEFNGIEARPPRCAAGQHCAATRWARRAG